MLSTAILKVLAKAILSGEQEKDAVAARLFHVLGRNWRWVRPLAGRYVETFAGGIRPRRRDLISFLRVDPGLVEAGHKYGHQIKILHWVTGPQPMHPVPAAQDWAIPRIETVGGLAEWLEVTPSELGWFADLKGLGYKHPQARLGHYHYRVLAKAGGSIRLIEIPKPRLKDLQRRILLAILDRIPSHPAVHGFVKGRSIQTFAAPHVGRRVVLRMDLENFFPSFAGVRVQSFFRTVGYPETVADLLGGLVTNAVPRSTWREVIKQPGYALGPGELWHVQTMYARPHLPQGAPSSPSLANLCCYRIDCRLDGLAQSAGATYTRYADDLAFSGGEGFASCVERFSTLVAVILNEEGFNVQHRKTRIMRPSTRQHLAGLVTNERLNVRRVHFDVLKAILTNCVRQSPETQNLESHPHFREHLQGRIAFIESVNPEKGKRLRAIFDKIRWE
ncbi:MAG TPA: reverse transcriptase family protein [Acidobacteriaceae bacterium]|nr:reverse transcriptase family protein [Acidobacteriaceae bacterium]